jgi:hypothetical protein
MLMIATVTIALVWIGGGPTTQPPTAGLASPAPVLAECPPRVPPPPSPEPRPTASPVVV